MSLDDFREFLEELRDNWQDKYWWLDHPELRTAMLGVIAGAVALAFHWLQLVMTRHMLQPEG